jgi:hypothetical protein
LTAVVTDQSSLDLLGKYGVPQSSAVNQNAAQ